VISILVDALTSPARLLKRLSRPDMPGDQIRRLLGRAARLAALLRSAPGERAKIVRELVEQVIVDDEGIMIKMRRGALLGVEASLCASEEPSGSTIELTAAVDFKRRGAETKLVLPGLAHTTRPRDVIRRWSRRSHVGTHDLRSWPPAAPDRCKIWPSATVSSGATSGAWLTSPS